MNNALEYTTNYTFDLAGNRLKKAVDKESDSDIDEETTYLYDAADRLLEENQEIGPEDRRTVYSWGTNGNATHPTSKTVTTSYDGSTPSVAEAAHFTYDLRGRLQQSQELASRFKSKCVVNKWEQDTEKLVDK